MRFVIRCCSVAALILLGISPLAPHDGNPHRPWLGDRAFRGLFCVHADVLPRLAQAVRGRGSSHDSRSSVGGLQALTADRSSNILAAFYGAGGVLAAALLAELFIRVFADRSPKPSRGHSYKISRVDTRAARASCYFCYARKTYNQSNGMTKRGCCYKMSNFLQFRNRCFRSFLILGLFLFLLIAFLKVVSGSLLLRPLETRFPPGKRTPGDQITGIVLIGGFHLDIRIADERFDIRTGMSQRVMETVRLSKLYPKAKILYSGGGTEAQLGKEILVRLGVERGRIILEDRSKSTAENASFSKLVVAPNRSEKWLLVTSAFHMPRAMGAFRAIGFPVEADPVDFKSSKKDADQGEQAVLALREYMALFAYWLSGQSNELFPSR